MHCQAGLLISQPSNRATLTQQPFFAYLLPVHTAAGDVFNAPYHPPVAQQWAKPIVVVPAVYDEWRRGRPPWACPDVSQNYMVCPLYQRLDRAAARYVPNHGYEAGVYLRFVLDYYERLPELIVFLQADADSILSHSVANMINRFDLAQFRAKRVSFLPLIQARWAP